MYFNQQYITEKFNIIKTTNDNFLNYIKAIDIEGSRFLLEDKVFLIVEGLGYEAKAKPRFVKDKNGIFAVEYVFYVQTYDDNEKIEIFRFYLTYEGRIVKLLESNEPANNICDFNDANVSSHICFGVLNAIINSSLFEPKP